LLALLAGLAGLPASLAYADDGGHGGGHGGGGDDKGDDDKDEDGGGNRIRAAVRNGEAVSLKDILLIVRRTYKGEVARIKLTGSGGRLIYNIRLIDSNNRLIEIRVNAKSRMIISAKGV
jgi:uncharacterized membrane protein YkoI